MRFGRLAAVAGADFSVREGEVLALVGPSGCGKTTLLRCIAGFERAAAGEVRLGGQTIESPARSVPPHQRSVGLVFQDYALFPHKTVEGNISYGLRGVASARDRVRELLELAGLEGLLGRYPHQLSGGQQQRVAVLRSLAPRPRVLLLDEPFSNLDPALRTALRDQIVDLLRREGVAAVLVTHDRGDALAVADRVAVMDAGRIIECDTPDGLYYRPTTELGARAGGEVQFLDGVARGGVVQTCLGLASAAAPVEDGHCAVLVRPEWIVPCTGSESGTLANIVRTRLEGHFVRHTIALDSGDVLEMTVSSGIALDTGSVVRVAVRVPAPVFPRLVASPGPPQDLPLAPPAQPG